MAFQDFDLIQQRVNADRKRKFRKKIIIGVVSTLVVVAAITGGAFAYVTYGSKSQEQVKTTNTTNKAKAKSSEKSESPPSQKLPPPSSAAHTVKPGKDDKKQPPPSSAAHSVKPGKDDKKQPPPSSAAHSVKPGKVDKIIQTLCNSTLYKPSCQKTLRNGTKTASPLSDPRSLLKSSIKATNDDLVKVFEKVLKLKTANKEEKDAIAQCKLLVEDAKEELGTSEKRINETKVNNFAKIAPDLDIWLSAVMSHQETCLDGFEEGKLKTEIRKNFNSSQMMTSNSLAMIKSLETYLSSAPKVIPKVKTRHLLESRTSWLSDKERRMLKAVDLKALKPNAIVAKDGSGNFTTINAALKAMPAKYKGRYTIYIKHGVYDESVIVDKKKANVTMVGDGSQKTIVTGNKSHPKKVRTFLTATFVAQGEGFMAHSMGFRNTAGPDKHQAVAIRVQSDRSVFQNCRFEGFQDTLYAYTHRQYYRSCVIVGTIDIIFGDAAALFQNCNIFIRKGVPGQKNTVTSQGRVDKFQTTGFVIQNCTIAPNEDLKPVKAQFKSYLGRPCKNHSRTVVMESTIEDVIDPVGWLRWQETDFAIGTLLYAEYKNDGPSGKTTSRVKWPGFRVIKKEEAMKYTVGPFLQGDPWIHDMGSPVKFGLYDA